MCGPSALFPRRCAQDFLDSSSAVNKPTHPVNSTSSAEYLPLYRPSPQASLFAGILFAALTVLLVGPKLTRLATELLGGPGGLADLWVIRSHTRDLFTAPWFETSASYPFGGTLAWGDNLLFPSLLLSPLIAAGMAPVAACNLLFMSALILNGYCCFRLVYQLTGTTPAALLAGAAFMTAPIFFGSLGTPSLSFFFLLPLTMSTTLRLVADPRARSGFHLGCICSFATFTSIALMLTTIVSAILLIISFVILHPHRWSWRMVPAPLFGIVLGLLPAIVILEPLAAARSVLDPIAPDILSARSATIKSFAPAHPLNLASMALRSPGTLELTTSWIVLIGGIFALRRLSDSGGLLVRLLLTLALTGAASLGAVPLPGLLSWLALIGCASLVHHLGRLERTLGVQIVTNRALIAIFFFVGVFFFLFSLGPANWRTESPGVLSVFSMIDRFALALVPLDSPAIGGIVVILALSILGAFTAARLRRRSSRALLVAPAVGLLTLLENYRPLPSTQLPSPTNIERYLETLDPGQIVIGSLPFPTHGSTAAPFLNSIFPTRLKSINGHSDRTTQFLSDIAHDTQDFPSARSIRALASIVGLRYIVVDESPTGRGAIVAAAGRFSESIRYVESDGAGRYLFEFLPETRLRSDFVLRAPNRSSGILHAQLQALYETGEPHVPLSLEWNDAGTWRNCSDAVVTANGQWADFSFPLPARSSSPRPLELRFITPPGARISLRLTGFTQDR